MFGGITRFDASPRFRTSSLLVTAIAGRDGPLACAQALALPQINPGLGNAQPARGLWNNLWFNWIEIFGAHPHSEVCRP
jgi:hypothetical protein